MHTRIEVRDTDGGLLGIFPGSVANHVVELRAILEAHPGAEVRPVVSVDDPCAKHPAFEADNCPVCGAAG